MERITYNLFGIGCLLCLSFSGFSQSLERESVSPAGNFLNADGVLVRQSIGQPYNTVSFYSNTLSCRPGFEQPIKGRLVITPDLVLSVFPNPATDAVFIESPIALDNVTLSCFDNQGKLVLNETIAHFKKYQFSCRHFPNAIYFISVTTADSKRFSAKLIVNR